MTVPPPAPSPAGFEEEALPLLDAVYRFALRLSGSPAAAEDLTQDTFVRAYRAWGQYTPGTNIRSWLFTICRNQFLRQQERRRRHDQILEREAPAAEDPGEHSPFAAAGTADPEGDFFASIIDEEILAAIDRLPEDFRTAVVLSDVEGLSYQEIADTVGVPVGTVKSRLFRGRRVLQGELYDYAASMGYIPQRGEEG